MVDFSPAKIHQHHSRAGLAAQHYVSINDFFELHPASSLSLTLGDILLTGSADNTARSWSFESAGCLKQFRGHTGAVTTMATDSSGRVLFTAGADSAVKSWNIQSAQLLKVKKETKTKWTTGFISAILIC